MHMYLILNTYPFPDTSLDIDFQFVHSVTFCLLEIVFADSRYVKNSLPCYFLNETKIKLDRILMNKY